MSGESELDHVLRVSEILGLYFVRHGSTNLEQERRDVLYQVYGKALSENNSAPELVRMVDLLEEMGVEKIDDTLYDYLERWVFSQASQEECCGIEFEEWKQSVFWDVRERWLEDYQHELDPEFVIDFCNKEGLCLDVTNFSPLCITDHTKVFSGDAQTTIFPEMAVRSSAIFLGEADTNALTRSYGFDLSQLVFVKEVCNGNN